MKQSHHGIDESAFHLGPQPAQRKPSHLKHKSNSSKMNTTITTQNPNMDNITMVVPNIIPAEDNSGANTSDSPSSIETEDIANAIRYGHPWIQTLSQVH